MDKRFRPMASGYSDAGASLDKRSMKGFTARSSSPNEDINWNNYTLRQRGRMLYMSSAVARSAIETNRTKVIGTGLTLKASIDGKTLKMSPEAVKDWQRKTEQEFSLWANNKENCDAIGMNSFTGLQQLVTVNYLVNGDIVALFQRDFNENPLNPYSLRIHMIEADRICTPNTMCVINAGKNTDGKNTNNGNPIYDGIEVDSHGKIVAIHICNVYPNQMRRDLKELKWKRVKVRSTKTGLLNFLMIKETERPDQYRGVSTLAPVIESVLNISRYTQSEVIAALVQCYFTAWIKTNTNQAMIPINEASYGADDDQEIPPDRNISENSNEYEMGPGMVTHLAPDEDIVFGNPQIPTPGFDTFVKVLCKEIGAALNIPYDVLMKEFNAS